MAPRFRLFVLNRSSISDFTEDIEATAQWSYSDQLLSFRRSKVAGWL